MRLGGAQFLDLVWLGVAPSVGVRFIGPAGPGLGGRDESRPYGNRGRFILVVVVAVMTAIMFVLTACGPSVNVTDDSPHVVSVGLASVGDGSEAGQCVLVNMQFDGSVACDGDAAGDFAVSLNGEPIDSEVMAVRVVADEPDTVTLSIVPSDKAATGKASKIFACYAGQVEVASARPDGALPHVKAADGSATAVMDAPISGVIPTGVSIVAGDAVAGDASAGVPASCTFTVEHGPVLRCCTWLDLGEGPVCYIHNHQFKRETPESCAAAFADMLNATASGFAATSDGASVTVVAQDVVDGQVLVPSVCEGVGVMVDPSVVDWD